MTPDDGAEARLELSDAAATEALGARLLAFGDDGVVHLHGDLGAGKTTLVRGFLRAAGHAGAVRSPTYTLLEPYAVDALRVFHFDLYRLADPAEFDEFGGRDHFAGRGWRFVEWPERAAEALAAPDLDLALDVVGDGRRARLVGRSPRGAAWVRALADDDGALR